MTAHKCAYRLKKKFDLRSGSQRHRHFVCFFNVPIQAPTRDQPSYSYVGRVTFNMFNLLNSYVGRWSFSIRSPMLGGSTSTIY